MLSQETTRWLLFAALRATYADNPVALDEAFLMMAQDLSDCLRHGLALRFADGEIVLRMCCVSVKGDWPFLIEAAHLERHFRRAPKRESSSRTNYGICHLCCGGMPGVSYTDVSDRPDWERTMFSAAALTPWDSHSPWQDLPGLPNFRPLTFRPDVFHNFHLGHGKYFLASALVILSGCQMGNSVEAKFQVLDADWKAYCARRRDARRLLVSVHALRVNYCGFGSFSCWWHPQPGKTLHQEPQP